MRRAGGAAGAGGMGPVTTADSVPVTRLAVPTLWPLCRRLAGPEGLTGPIPPAPAASPARSLYAPSSCGRRSEIIAGPADYSAIKP